MGMQDRDYYKEAWKKRDLGDIHGYHNGHSKHQNYPSTSPPAFLWPWLKICFRYLYYVFLAALALRLVIKLVNGTYL